MEDFADWLKTNRKRKGLSLRKLADKMGNICSDAYLSQLENRRYLGKAGQPMRPDKNIVIALARVFNADENNALTLADYAPETPDNKTATYELLEGAAVIFDEKKFTKAEQERLFAAMRMLAKGAKADKENELSPEDKD